MRYKKHDLKRAKFVKELFDNNFEIHRAYIKVYGKKKNYVLEKKLARDVMRADGTQKIIKKAMKRAGLAPESLARKLSQFVDEGTKKHVLKKMKPSDGLKAIDMSAKLQGMYPAEKRQISKRVEKLSVSLEGKSKNELLEMFDKKQKELKDFQSVLKASQ